MYLTPITGTTYADLSKRAQEDYAVDGPATHSATTDLGETVLCFPCDGGHLVLVWKQPDAYLADADGFDHCPDEWEFEPGELTPDDDGRIYLKTTTSF